MSIINLLSAKNFCIYNRSIAINLGVHEAIIFGELCSEHSTREVTNQLKDGYFYSTIDNLKRNTGLSERLIRQAIKTLIDNKILDTKTMGLPSKRYFKINEIELEKWASKKISCDENGECVIPSPSGSDTPRTIKSDRAIPVKTVTALNNNELINNEIINNELNLNNKDCEIYKDREENKGKENKKEKSCRADATTVCVADSTSDKLPYKEIINYLNSKTGSNYKATTEKTRKLIKTRFNEGFNLQDFYTVIDKKTLDWLRDENMSKFLRPETLFGNKFEGYLNQKKRQLTTGDLNYSMNDFNDFIDFNSFPTYNKGDENKK